MDAESDEVLLDRMLGGAEEAFTALYRRRHPAIYRFALQMSGDSAMAEDVTQETFLVLLRQGARFQAHKGSLTSYLYGIARNHVLKRLDPVVSSEDTECEETVFEDLSRRQTVEQVRGAVLSLPPAYREVVVLCDLQEASYEEAAAALECPVGTVRSRLSRARALLAQKLHLYSSQAVCRGNS
jgi:RNA polymerase sigma-70 factor (ECF subfamily)